MRKLAQGSSLYTWPLTPSPPKALLQAGGGAPYLQKEVLVLRPEI
jgi:hypothetical protein